MRRSHNLLVVLALVLGAGRALAQQPMPPYGESSEAPRRCSRVRRRRASCRRRRPAIPPVPPPGAAADVVPPPGGWYQQQPPLYYQPPMQLVPVPAPRASTRSCSRTTASSSRALVILGVSWSINAAIGLHRRRVEARRARHRPVHGDAEHQHAADSADDRLLVGLLVFDGLIETAGAVMLVAGALTHHRVQASTTRRERLGVSRSYRRARCWRARRVRSLLTLPSPPG